jgi:O-antigen ligase
MAAGRGEAAAGGGTMVRAALFFAMLAYYWISLAPFPDLTLASNADPWAGNSNTLNQAVAIVLFATLVVFALRHPLVREVAQPRLLLGLIFGWLVITALLAGDPMTALRRVVMAGMVCVGASIFLLLPRDEKHFARLLGTALLLLLALAYWGVWFWPARAIHLASDVVEPQLAGLWRGFFAHKNTAAAAMTFAVFGGMFVWARWSRLAGALIVVGALYFLVNSGGKTSLALLPLVLGFTYVFERVRGSRYLLVVGGIGVFNLVVVGSAVLAPFRDFVASLGVDASFTDRTAIWQFAFDAFASRPLTGYGFTSFWQTGSLVYGGGTLETWAVTAANAHNAYLDTLLTAGVPGLVLVVVWLLFRPIADVARAEASGNDPLLTRLFLRLWLYGIFASSLESFFFANGGPVWFTMLIGVFGLGMQGRSALVVAPQASWRFAHV